MALGWFRRLRGRAKSGTANPTQWLIDWVRGGDPTASAISVTPESAMRCAAVFSCVRVLSEDVAKLPLIIYRRKPDGGRERADTHPLYRILARSPNPRQTAFEFREMMHAHLELRGNAYAVIERDGSARVTALWPQHPDTVEVRQAPDGDLFYRLKRPGGDIMVPGADMLHIRSMSSDGIMGISTVSSHREAIGLALAAEKYGAQFFANDAQPRGLLYHPDTLGDMAAKNIKGSWQKRMSGEERHSVAVLEEGMKYQQIGMTNEDAQFLETRMHQRTDIASIFRIPPHKIGDLTRSTFANIEQQNIEYVVDSLLPRLTRWEQCLARALLTEKEQDGYIIEFLLDSLLRGDIASRYAAYAVARQWGWLSANDIRDLENMNRIPNGDIYLYPLNEGEAGKPPPAPPAGEPPPKTTPDPTERLIALVADRTRGAANG